MLKVSKTERDWRRWLESLADPAPRLSVELGGFPGHMRLPRGWKTRGSFPREHLLYLVVEGALEVAAAGKMASLSKGEILWIRPGTPFVLSRGGAETLSVLRCRAGVMGKAGTVVAPWPWRVWRAGKVCLPWIEGLVREADRPDAWSPFRLRSLLGGLFAELARFDALPQEADGGLSAAQRRALEALLAERADCRASPRELAGAAGLSFDYFSRCFRRAYGRTPRRWLLEQRMEAAMLRLAETELRVGEIAADLGYADVFLFSRQFKVIAGVSPLAFRRDRLAVRPAPGGAWSTRV